MAYGLNNEQLLNAASLARQQNVESDPDALRRIAQQTSEQAREEELSALDERYTKAVDKDAANKAGFAAEDTKKLIAAGVGALKLGATVQKGIQKKNEDKTKVQEQAQKKATKIGERAQNLAGKGRLSAQKAEKLAGKQSKMLEKAGYTQPGDLYTNTNAAQRQQENVDFESKMARETSLKGSDKPIAEGFKDQLMEGRRLKDAEGRNIGDKLAQLSKLEQGQREDIKLANQLKRTNPEAYQKLIDKYPYLVGK